MDTAHAKYNGSFKTDPQEIAAVCVLTIFFRDLSSVLLISKPEQQQPVSLYRGSYNANHGSNINKN